MLSNPAYSDFLNEIQGISTLLSETIQTRTEQRDLQALSRVIFSLKLALLKENAIYKGNSSDEAIIFVNLAIDMLNKYSDKNPEIAEEVKIKKLDNKCNITNLHLTISLCAMIVLSNLISLQSVLV